MYVDGRMPLGKPAAKRKQGGDRANGEKTGVAPIASIRNIRSYINQILLVYITFTYVRYHCFTLF